MNSGGSRKTISSAYGNVGGSRKQIYPYSATTSTTYYYWDRHELSVSGSLTKTSNGLGRVVVGGSEGSYYVLIGYGSSCISADGNGTYMTWEDSKQLYYVSDVCGWGKYFAIVSSVPSTNKIYAKNTFDGNLYTCNHNMYWRTLDQKLCVCCSDTSDTTCVLVVKYTATYSKGTYIDEVSSTNATKYPSNNYSGSYWYVYDRSEVVYS